MRSSKFNRITPQEKSNDFTVEIHVTEMCNYSCSYCNLSPMNAHDSIDYNKLFSLDIPTNSRIFLMGGEPTIDQHFYDIIDECYRRGYTDIDVQTNLTFNVDKMVSTLLKNKTPVKFYGSYHMEYSKINKFISKCTVLKDHDMYGGIHLMWVNSEDKKCIRYYNILNNVLGNVSLEPTLPKTATRAAWDKKSELNSFITKGHLSMCHRLRNKIDIDDQETTIGEALLYNYEKDVLGKKCYAPTNTVVFSVNKNRFYYCTFDLILDRGFSENQFNLGHCVCQNQVCCADLEYRKEVHDK